MEADITGLKNRLLFPLILILLSLFFMAAIVSSSGAASGSDLSFRFVDKYPSQEKPPLAFTPAHLAFDSEGNLYIADPPNNKIVSLNPDGSFRLAWGKNGASEGEFKYPMSVAVSSDNRVYVTDRNNHRVQVFDTRGEYLFEIKNGFDFGLSGGVTIGIDQRLYVADSDNDRIQVFTLDGTFIEHIEGGLDSPCSASPISSNQVAVCDFRNNELKIFTRWESGWAVERRWHVTGPWQVVFDPVMNHLAVTDAYTGIILFDLDGNEVSRIETIDGRPFELCSGVAINLDGKYAAGDRTIGMAGVYTDAGIPLWSAGMTPSWTLSSPVYGTSHQNGDRIIADTWNNRLAVFNNNGSYAQEVCFDQFWSVLGLDSDQTGGVWLINQGHQKSQLFHLFQDLSLIESINLYGEGAGQLNKPYDLTIAENGLAYVVDYGLHKVAVFDNNGSFIWEWGNYGSEPGELKYPQGITSDGDRIYVGDTSNNRIQIFDLNGNFIKSMGQYGTAPGDLNQPAGLAVHGNKIFVAEKDNNRVSIFDLNGNHLGTIGNHGTKDGELTAPMDCFVDGKGMIHVVDTGNNRIQIFTENSPPSARISTNVPLFGFTASFESLSTDDEAIVESLWEFGDGTSKPGTLVEHTYGSQGSWLVSLTVKDAQGLTDTLKKEIIISQPPDIAFNTPLLTLAPSTNANFELTGAEGMEVSYSLNGGGSMDCHGYVCTYTAPGQPGNSAEATITAFLRDAPDIKCQAVIYLKSRVITSIVANSEKMTLSQGDQETVGLTALYSDGTTEPITDQAVWTVDPDSLAEVTGGTVRAVEPGMGTIIASFGERSVSIPLEIKNGQEHGVTGAKAIIIAAGGVARSNTLWPYTNELTFDFYRLMLAKGLKKDDIHFITFSRDHDVDDDGIADSIEKDLDVTVRTIEWAFEWAQKEVNPGKPLFIFISGHGGQGIIELNRKTGETITGEQLRGFLNRIQPDVPEVVVIEACYSGSLIESISGRNRVIITSTAKESPAYVIKENSFARQFIRASRQITDLQKAFELSSDRLLADFKGQAEQSPQLDDDGDRIANTTRDGALAGTIPYSFLTAAAPPTIMATSGAQDINGTCAHVWIKMSSLEAQVKKVSALVLPPDYKPATIQGEGITIPEIKEIPFAWNRSEERWEALVSGLDQKGQWRLRITADAGQAGKDFEDLMINVISLDENPGDDHELPSVFKLTTNSSVYLPGDELLIQSELKGEGRFDVYYAIILPDKSFLTFKEDETFSRINTIIPYKLGMVLDGTTRYERILTIPTLPALPPGEYMVFGILAESGTDIFKKDAVFNTGFALFQFPE